MTPARGPKGRFLTGNLAEFRTADAASYQVVFGGVGAVADDPLGVLVAQPREIGDLLGAGAVQVDARRRTPWDHATVQSARAQRGEQQRDGDDVRSGHRPSRSR